MKPCPFCGEDNLEVSEQEIIIDGKKYYGAAFVRCKGCGTCGPRISTKKKNAVKYWEDRK